MTLLLDLIIGAHRTAGSVGPAAFRAHRAWSPTASRIAHTTTLIAALVTAAIAADAQLYTEQQTRHRFAQLSVGLDYQTNTGGTSSFVNSQGELQQFRLPNTHIPRIAIGGTHFWGHAEFEVAIPLLYPTLETNEQELSYGSSIETIFKYYPWRIEHHKLRPFVGVSITPYFFQQTNSMIDSGIGPVHRFTSLPLLFGMTYNSGASLVELGSTWNYNNKQRYHVDRTTVAEIATPALYFALSYRHLFDTTISAEEDWESGETKRVTKALGDQGRLNDWFLGVGLSGAFWIGTGEYNRLKRPFLPNYGISLLPDFTLGYYMHEPDLNIALNYRPYSKTVEAYGVAQNLQRRSIGLELTKYLFDYHGFVPFVGPIISYEMLQFEERGEGHITHSQQNMFGYGLTFGWDIRPNRIQSWILRTNLRLYPDLGIAADRKQVAFSNVEFNFIQLIIYPDRFFD